MRLQICGLDVQIPRSIVKARSRRLTILVDSFTDSHESLVGTTQSVCITDTATDGHHLVGHTKNYSQASTIPSISLKRQRNLYGPLIWYINHRMQESLRRTEQ